MIHKMKIGVTLLALLGASLLSAGNDSRISDDYARAALRAVIYTKQSGIDAQQISAFLNEADVEASTPAEEESLKEINRILGNWFSRPILDNNACYVALKRNLKARNGAIPEACK